MPCVAFAPVQSPLAVHAVALVELQDSDAELPWTIAFGTALNATVGGGFAGITLTVTACEAVPPAPEQISANVVLAVRPARASEPLSPLVPLHPPVAVQAVALVAVQLSVVVPPLAIVDGVALSEIEGGGSAPGDLTVTFTDCVAAPPLPLHVNANDALTVSGPVLAVPDTGLTPLQLPDAVQPLALLELHVSVAAAPELTLAGDTDSETEVPDAPLFAGVTFAVTVWPAVPPGPVHVSA